MRLNNIESNRLLLVPVTLELIDRFKDGIIHVDKQAYNLHEGWPTPDTNDIIPFVTASLKKQGRATGFEFWIIIEREHRVVIGDIGFHGPPDQEGAVEIGFGLVEAYRSRGYGYEALQAILDWIKEKEDVKVVEANCLIDNIPSKRILQKVGMLELYRNANFIFWAMHNRS